jgi:hypothetical protein
LSHTGAAINDTPEKRKSLKKNYGYIFGYFKCKLSMPVLALGGAQSFGPLMVNMVKEVAMDVRRNDWAVWTLDC